MSQKYILQVYLEEQDRLFIQAYAKEHGGLSLSQAMLDMADYYDKRNAWYLNQGQCPNPIGGIDFSTAPLDDYKEY